MARNPRQAALYELINKTRFKNAQLKALADVSLRIDAAKHPGEKQEAVPQVQTPAPAQPQVQPEVAKTNTVRTARPEVVWSGRQKPVRVYPDRIELCLTWQVAAITGLVILAILLMFFRLGQNSATKKAQTAKVVKPAIPVQSVIPESAKPAVAEKRVTAQNPPKMVEPMGENVIVITSYDLSSHLEPVKQYFAQYGIATEIIKRGPRYLLVTQNRFNNIDKPGTDGYEMKKKIISVGANYKSPAGSGFESFGTKPFQDVYGMKAN